MVTTVVRCKHGVAWEVPFPEPDPEGNPVRTGSIYFNCDCPHQDTSEEPGFPHEVRFKDGKLPVCTIGVPGTAAFVDASRSDQPAAAPEPDLVPDVEPEEVEVVAEEETVAEDPEPEPTPEPEPEPEPVPAAKGSRRRG